MFLESLVVEVSVRSLPVASMTPVLCMSVASWKVPDAFSFAMKCLDKRRLKLKHQEASSVHERNVLAEV